MACLFNFFSIYHFALNKWKRSQLPTSLFLSINTYSTSLFSSINEKSSLQTRRRFSSKEENMSTGLESLIMQLSALLQENTECMKDVFERIEKVEEKITILTHLEMKRQGIKIPHASTSSESSMKKLKN